MAFPTIDPATPQATPQEIEVLLDLEHQLDVANDDHHPARPPTWGTRAPEAVSRSAPKVGPRPGA